MTFLIFCLMLLIKSFAAFSFGVGYDFLCPPPSQWSARASLICGKKSHYNCLWNGIQSRYDEYCGYDEFSRQGFKYVLMPNPQEVPCSETFYQPITFTSKENSRCLYLKSGCTGEGQVVASNGTGDSDRRCRCDYTKNFVFVNQPEDRCTCIQSQEDCSCSYKPCNSEKEELRRDYKCHNEYLLPERIPCENIITSTQKTNSGSNYRPSDITEKLIQGRVSSIPVQIVILIGLVFLGMCSFLLIQEQSFVKNYVLSSKCGMYIKIEGNRYGVLKGDTINLSCELESMFRSYNVAWKREENGNIHDIINDKHFEIFSAEGNPSLKIHNFTREISGAYYCDLNTAYNFRKLLHFFMPLLVNRNVTLDLLEFQEEETILSLVHSEITIKCPDILRNYPDKSRLTYNWIKQNIILSHLEPHSNPYNQITIKDCSKSDSGTYICVVSASGREIIKESGREIIKESGREIIEKLCFQVQLQIKSIEEQYPTKELKYLVEFLEKDMGTSVATNGTTVFDTDYFIAMFKNVASRPFNLSMMTKIGHNMYNYLNRESNDTLRIQFIDALKALDYPKNRVIQNEGNLLPHFSPWNIIILIETMTLDNQNTWMFENDVSDFMLLCLLIVAVKRKYLEQNTDMNRNLISTFRDRLTGKKSNVFVKSMEMDFDSNENTFIHYIVIVGSNELLSRMFDALSEEWAKHLLCRANKLGRTPIEMAAFLGKSKLLNILPQGTPDFDTHQLTQILRSGMNIKSKQSSTFIVKNFESDILKQVSCISGSKVDYEDSLNLTKQLYVIER